MVYGVQAMSAAVICWRRALADVSSDGRRGGERAHEGKATGGGAVGTTDSRARLVLAKREAIRDIRQEAHEDQRPLRVRPSKSQKRGTARAARGVIRSLAVV